MTFREYADRFFALKEYIAHLKGVGEVEKSRGYRSFLQDAEECGALKELPERVLLPPDTRQKIERLQRLCGKYMKRFGEACDRIEKNAPRQIAVYHYLYGMTFEEVAEVTHYAVRSVYRHMHEARAELEANLIAGMPKARRTRGKKYHLSAASRRTLRLRRARQEKERRASRRHPNVRPFCVRPDRIRENAREKTGSNLSA